MQGGSAVVKVLVRWIGPQTRSLGSIAGSRLTLWRQVFTGQPAAPWVPRERPQVSAPGMCSQVVARAGRPAGSKRLWGADEGLLFLCSWLRHRRQPLGKRQLPGCPPGWRQSWQRLSSSDSINDAKQGLLLISLSELVENKPLRTWLVDLLLIPPAERMRLLQSFVG